MSIQKENKRAKPRLSFGQTLERSSLIVIGKIVVGSGDGRGAMNGVNEAVIAVGEVAMVHPDIMGCKHVDAISIASPSTSQMRGRASDDRVSSRFAVMNVDAMDNDVAHILECVASATSDVDIVIATINCLEAVHDKLLLKSDHHVACEDDPKRLTFHNTVAQRAGSRIDDIVASVISDNMDLAVLTTDRILPESGHTVCQRLSRALPVVITPPAIIDGISRATHPKHSSRIIITPPLQNTAEN